LEDLIHPLKSTGTEINFKQSYRLKTYYFSKINDLIKSLIYI